MNMERAIKPETSFFGISMPRRPGRRTKPGPFATEDEEEFNFEAQFATSLDDPFMADGSDFFSSAFSDDLQRTRRAEFQERSNMRERVNNRLKRENSFEEIPLSRGPPVRKDSWNSVFSDHFVSSSSRGEKHQEQESTEIEQEKPISTKPKARNVQTQGNSGFWPDFLEGGKPSFTHQRPTVLPEGQDERVGETATEVSTDDEDSYDPYRLGPDNSEHSNSSEDATETTSKGNNDYANKLKRTTSSQSAALSRFLESSSWFGQGEVVVVNTGSSRRKLPETRVREEKSVSPDLDQTEDTSPTRRHRNDKPFKPFQMLRKMMSFEDDEKNQDIQASSADKKENKQHNEEMKLTQKETSRMKDARRASASSIDWPSLLLTNSAPKSPDSDDEEKRHHHIQSTEKTKCSETIAAASILCSNKGSLPQRKSKSSIRGRGRRAVETWRRKQRATKRKEKQKEEMAYAFNLEFEPSALKPMEFTKNVFRAPGSPPKRLFGKEPAVSLIRTDDSLTEQEKHAEGLEADEEWQRDMTKLFEMEPEQHRKNRKSRASF